MLTREHTHKRGTLFDLLCDQMQFQGWICVWSEDWGTGEGSNAHFLPQSPLPQGVGIGVHIPEARIEEGGRPYVWTFPIL